ncbi:hypothetical protein D3C86_2150930 [compost metagenome]
MEQAAGDGAGQHAVAQGGEQGRRHQVAHRPQAAGPQGGHQQADFNHVSAHQM